MTRAVLVRIRALVVSSSAIVAYRSRLATLDSSLLASLTATFRLAVRAEFSLLVYELNGHSEHQKTPDRLLNGFTTFLTLLRLW